MTTPFETPPGSIDHPLSITERLSSLLNERFSHVELPLRSFNAATTGLTITYFNNGKPDSEDFKEYHNEDHPFEMLERALSILDLLKKAGIDVRPEHYEIVTVATAFHDAYQAKPDWLSETDKQKSVEELSADLALRYMPIGMTEDDQNGFTDEERQFVASAIEVTEGQVVDGAFMHTKLFEPNRHFTAWVVALADTGEALFEGEDNVMKTVSTYGSESPDAKSPNIVLARTAFMKLLSSEKRFFEQIGEDVERGIEHFFPEHSGKVTQVFHDRFGSHYSHMLKVAEVIDHNLSLFSTSIEDGLTNSKDTVMRRAEIVHRAIVNVLHNLLPRNDG